MHHARTRTHAHAHTAHTAPYAKRGTIVQDGKMYPAIARMFVAPLDMTPFFQKRIRFLRDVPDLNLAPLMYVREAADSDFKRFAHRQSTHTHTHTRSPFATTEYTYYGMRGAKCKPKHLLADGFVVKELDIKTVTAQELQRVSAPIAIKPKRKGTFNGWGAWFEVVFPGETADKDVVLSTAPEQPYAPHLRSLFVCACVSCGRAVACVWCADGNSLGVSCVLYMVMVQADALAPGRVPPGAGF